MKKLSEGRDSSHESSIENGSKHYSFRKKKRQSEHTNLGFVFFFLTEGVGYKVIYEVGHSQRHVITDHQNLRSGIKHFFKLKQQFLTSSEVTCLPGFWSISLHSTAMYPRTSLSKRGFEERIILSLNASYSQTSLLFRATDLTTISISGYLALSTFI